MIFESLELEAETLEALDAYRAAQARYASSDTQGDHERLMDAAERLARLFSTDMEQNGR